METIFQRPAGTGAYMLAERLVGQRIRMTANPSYWRQGEPICSDYVLTVFGDDAAASAALESGAVDIVYAGTSRSAVRLRNAGFQLVQGPGMLVQVLRLNSTRGPFRNLKFRQAFTFLMDRAAILRAGYAGLGEVTVLPWVPASPAWDPSYNERYAFNLERARELLRESGLSQAEQSNWRLTVNSGDEPTVLISQIVQATVARVGMTIQLDMKVGAEMQDAVSNGRFDATFWGAGNVQKFPSRLAANSIYRTQNNAILGEPNPHRDYVAAIARVNSTLGSGADVRAAYDSLNRALVEDPFAIATNTYDFAPIVAARNVGGITREIDNMLVARTIGFTS
jgi:ABC-type transport system substrate-binding protein